MGLQTVTGPYRKGIIFLPGDVHLLGDALKLLKLSVAPMNKERLGLALAQMPASTPAVPMRQVTLTVPSWDRRPDHVRRMRLLMKPCGWSHEEAALKSTGLPFQEKDGMARKTFAQMAAAK